MPSQDALLLSYPEFSSLAKTQWLGVLISAQIFIWVIQLTFSKWRSFIARGRDTVSLSLEGSWLSVAWLLASLFLSRWVLHNSMPQVFKEQCWKRPCLPFSYHVGRKYQRWGNAVTPSSVLSRQIINFLQCQAPLSFMLSVFCHITHGNLWQGHWQQSVL